MDTETNKQKCQSDEPPTRYGFDSLPKEIVLDIASRLPITSLVQFKFVRKSFYNLSHDPELVNLHLSHALKNDPCIIFHVEDNQLYFLELSDLGMEKVVSKISTPFSNFVPGLNVVIGSCHGLLCTFDCLFGDALYVYNPFTGDYKQLPCDIRPFEEEFVLGFGFHPITKEYKVIKIIYYDNLFHVDGRSFNVSKVEVFTLGGNSWRRIEKVDYLIESKYQGIMLNGKMHWLTRFGKYYGRRDRLIVSFDFAAEVFSVVPKVDFVAKPRIHKFHLAVLGDCLAVALTLPRQKGGGTEIWVMKEYNVKEMGEGVHNWGLYTNSKYWH
ncbi:PREDICTED: F-box protein At3g07870-like [Nicotiana attenuata]|uniref:F-box protein n=1 Tax=Nicotiana attenuata TaxID=49451 RepID=A0A1J6ICS9_NICAT|nr:PREDICTED: F-box protein At3g07870-like [Nicotiana attenuata]OIT02204.1 f-box protein [Nicotiana attenuata]